MGVVLVGQGPPSRKKRGKGGATCVIKSPGHPSLAHLLLEILPIDFGTHDGEVTL